MNSSSTEPVLKVTNLQKQFANEYALNDVSFELDKGRFLGLVGPDGAGKTTLLRIIAGLFEKSAGSVRVLGKEPGTNSPELRDMVGYMPQRFGLYEDLTIIENLNLNADLRHINGNEREESFERLLTFTDLKRFQTRKAGALSGGMKQKLGLACALLAKPELLLLDEPSVGVDPISRRELWKMVHALVEDGMSVVWSTAYLDEAEICKDVILLNEGNILYQGAPKQLTQTLQHRAYKVGEMKTGRRQLLATLLDHSAISDGVIDGHSLRLITSKGHTMEDIVDLLPDFVTYNEVEPRFEDAFIDLLGGNPGGHSVVAEQMPEKNNDPKRAMVEAKDLSKRFGDFYATNQVNFNIKPGEIFGLLGPNGAGKSTTFKMMCGLIRPTQGQALVTGLNLQKAGGNARKKIGYMAQKFSLYGNLTVKQNLEFFSGAYGLKGQQQKHRVKLMIEIFDLNKYLNASPDDLPLGFKQRLALACSIMHEPDILFLDEPTSGVDPITRREFWTHIYGLTGKGMTVMVTTHFMDEAEYCDRIGFVSRGQLIALGTPDDLKAQVSSEALPHPTMEDCFVELVEQQTREREAAA